MGRTSAVGVSTGADGVGVGLGCGCEKGTFDAVGGWAQSGSQMGPPLPSALSGPVPGRYQAPPASYTSDGWAYETTGVPAVTPSMYVCQIGAAPVIPLVTPRLRPNWALSPTGSPTQTAVSTLGVQPTVQLSKLL